MTKVFGPPDANIPICVMEPGSTTMLTAAFDNRVAVVQRIDEAYLSLLSQEARKEMYTRINGLVTDGADKYAAVGAAILYFAPSEGSA